jgi:hypothetical protein
MATDSSTDLDEPQEGRLLQIPGEDGPRSDIPTQVITFAVALALPDLPDPDGDAAAYGGRMLQDALSLYGLSVAGIVHHRDGSALFPDGVPELPDPADVVAGTGAAATGDDSAADAQADPDAETDDEVVEPAAETGSNDAGPRERSEPTSA